MSAKNANNVDQSSHFRTKKDSAAQAFGIYTQGMKVKDTSLMIIPPTGKKKKKRSEKETQQHSLVQKNENKDVLDILENDMNEQGVLDIEVTVSLKAN